MKAASSKGSLIPRHDKKEDSHILSIEDWIIYVRVNKREKSKSWEIIKIYQNFKDIQIILQIIKTYIKS